MSVLDLIRPQIRALSAYHVADATGLVKLDAMENPYGWPDALKRDWLRTLESVQLNRYPDAAARELRAALAERLGLAAGVDILLGNGSDELIQILAMAVAAPGRVIVAPEPSFVMYRMIATFTGLGYRGVPLTADFELDDPAMHAAVVQPDAVLSFIAYPNNPTGNRFPADAVRALVAAAPGLVVVDEAYHPFAGHSLLSEAGRPPNLVVMRTLSKLGLAGLRLGYLVAGTDLVAELDKLRLPYNINVLTQATVRFALQHWEVLEAQATTLRAARQALSAALARLPGVTVYPSEANFLLVRMPRGRADTVFAALRSAGILVKNLNAAGGLLADCLRITVGTADENDRVLSALDRALAEVSA